jgi:hypothetical protein
MAQHQPIGLKLAQSEQVECPLDNWGTGYGENHFGIVVDRSNLKIRR